MEPTPPNDFDESGVPGTVPGDPIPLPRRFYHHPVIALSLIFILASIVQVITREISSRMPAPTLSEPSLVTVHGLLFEALTDATEMGMHRWALSLAGGAQATTVVPGDAELRNLADSRVLWFNAPALVALGMEKRGAMQPVVYLGCFLALLASAVGWYVAVRSALGPSWAMGTGLIWVAHPAFALLAQRPGELSLLVAIIPLCWFTLIAWEHRRRWWIAVVAGGALALVASMSLQGLLLLPLVVLLMVVTSSGARRISQPASAIAGFLLAGGLLLPVVRPVAEDESRVDGRSGFVERFQEDFWFRLDDGDGSTIAAAAHEHYAGQSDDVRSAPWSFLVTQFRESPRNVIVWLASRWGRTLYSTLDGTHVTWLKRVQIAGLIPAVWGFVIALRHAAWRWAAVTGGLFIAVAWMLAAVAEPLARNLTPVGGLTILFALIGLADVYYRIRGRRLRPSIEHGLG